MIGVSHFTRIIFRRIALLIRRSSGAARLYTSENDKLYFTSKEFGLEGRRKGTDLQTRLTGLECLLDAVSSQQSVLDLGCAEGLVAREFCRRGCGKVVGFDLQKNSIQMAKKVFSAKSVERNFRQGNLSDWDMFLKTNEDILDHQYDIVLLLECLPSYCCSSWKKKSETFALWCTGTLPFVFRFPNEFPGS